MEKLHENHFFGKYVKMNIPNDYIDISKYRIIPDNQEVYAHKYNNNCLIIEIVCYKDIDIKEKGKYYFDDLANENTSLENKIILNNESVPHPQKNYILVVGAQKISKYNTQMHENVLLYLCIIPYKEHNADILITWNIPKEDLNINPDIDIFTEMVQSFKVLDFSLFV
ncbi:nuclear import protein MOG1, putative [Plasmodium chabaudi chabaudi]|uniref:Nuclear import protein MOG1, putative n=1 Tax=Plasmodium chabaudi chabaudi TaxID=31271 RepID=A0A4V6Z8M9_PLACU|nr:nuclear import protein MOG1, putative [Plasmodium chabaudi chabaudi]VTZ70589.1 nuclear import protein MOG1, putative [Plasmodium chabaudi chabaudi]|eukprot:XP_744186.1 nuclear import protein MOG1, putative [Plasmodium chabaudi chabaudi]